MKKSLVSTIAFMGLLSSAALASPPYTDSRLTGIVLPQPAAPVRLEQCVGYAGQYSQHVSANAGFTNRTPLIITQVQFRYEIVGQDFEPKDVHFYTWDGYFSPGVTINPKFGLIGYKPMTKWWPGTDSTDFIRCAVTRVTFSDSRQWYASPADLQPWSPLGDVLFHRRINSTLP